MFMKAGIVNMKCLKYNDSKHHALWYLVLAWSVWDLIFVMHWLILFVFVLSDCILMASDLSADICQLRNLLSGFYCYCYFSHLTWSSYELN